MLFRSKKRRIKGRSIYHYRELADDDELKALIQQDHQTWLDSFPDDVDEDEDELI